MREIQIDTNPLDTCIKFLQEQGFNDEQSKNLLKCIHAKSRDDVVVMVRDWLKFIEETKMSIALIELAANGMINVTRDNSGEFLYSKNW